MKDLLGGKGSGLAEMTNAGLPVPPGFTITTAACNLWYANHRKLPQAIEDEMMANVRTLEALVGQQFGSTDNPLLVSVRSGAKFSMPGHDGHDPQPRPQRRRRRRAQGEDRQRPLRLRQLPPVHPDVRQRRARDPEGQVRARVRGGQARARRRASTPTCGEDGLREVVAALQAASSRSRREGRSRRIRCSSCACRATRCSAPGTTPARSRTAASTRSPTTSAPPSTCRRWCSATPATARRPASASRGTPRPAPSEFFGEFLVNAQGEDVVAGIRTPQPIAELEQGDAEGVQGAAARSRRGSRSTTRTCRTSSSRSRTRSSTCSRRATASAPATRRS